jgi:hypothetical protein
MPSAEEAKLIRVTHLKMAVRIAQPYPAKPWDSADWDRDRVWRRIEGARRKEWAKFVAMRPPPDWEGMSAEYSDEDGDFTDDDDVDGYYAQVMARND